MVGSFETGPKKEKALQQAQAVMEAALLFWVTWPGNLCGSEGIGGREKHCVVFMGSSDRKISSRTPRLLELDHSIYSREVYIIQNKASGTPLDPGKGWASDYGTSNGHAASCGHSEQAVSSGTVDPPALHCKMGEEPSWYCSHRTRGYK